MGPWILPILLSMVSQAFQEPVGVAHRTPGPGAVHRGEQGRLLRQAEWTRFRRGEGEGWMARFDEASGAPFVAWGRGIPAAWGGGDVEEGVWSFLGRNAPVFGLDLDSLVVDGVGHVKRTGSTWVSYVQEVGGLPVVGSGVTVGLRQDRIVMVRTRVARVVLPWETHLDGDGAIRAAVERGPVPHAEHRVTGVEPVYFLDARRRAVPAWKVSTETVGPVGRWDMVVDALTGQVLQAEDQVRYLEGTIWGQHDDRSPGEGLTVSPMPYIQATDGGGATYANGLGEYTLDADDGVSRLTGSYVVVRNGEGEDGVLALAGGDSTWTDGAATQAEIDAYVFVNDVRLWAWTFAPEVSVSTSRIQANVNLPGECNAYWDGNVNFYREGGGCNNSARIADVVYHEWCHGFHYASLEAGSFDGTISEGVGDICSALLTGDSVVGQDFFLDGGIIRDVEEDRVYPDDLVGETHEDSIIFSGAVWDLWKALEADLGEVEAHTLVSGLTADAIKSGPTLSDIYDAFLFADDDDGDLSNGTPHQCQILDAFAAHGLSSLGEGALVTLAHDPVSNQPAGDAVPLAADIVNLAPTCVDFSRPEVGAWYSTDGGESWRREPLEVVGDWVDGALPAMERGSVVLYYLEASSGDTTVTAPTGGAIAPFSFYVGDPARVAFEDFEEDDGGYTHQLLSGEEEKGADDWQHGAPVGEDNDPVVAFSGENLWGNDLGKGNWDGQYQNDKNNRLTSPSFSVAPYNEVLLQFRRWLTVEDGFYDQVSILVDGERAWENHATTEAIGDEHHQDDQWILASLLVDDGDLDGAVTFSWDLVSDAGLTFGGWNLDDVEVSIPDTPRNLMTILDFRASDDLPQVQLQWTQPTFDDLEKVAVLWRVDRYPTHPEDGTVVYEGGDLAPGQPATVPLEDGKEGYYAIFAVDGAGTWTRGAYKGYNADQGAFLPGAPEDTAVDSGEPPVPVDTGSEETGGRPAVLGGQGKCGCGTGGAAGGMSWILVLLATLGNRRRSL